MQSRTSITRLQCKDLYQVIEHDRNLLGWFDSCKPIRSHYRPTGSILSKAPASKESDTGSINPNDNLKKKIHSVVRVYNKTY